MKREDLVDCNWSMERIFSSYYIGSFEFLTLALDYIRHSELHSSGQQYYIKLNTRSLISHVQAHVKRYCMDSKALYYTIHYKTAGSGMT